MCLRGDTDFSLTAHFDRWARRGVDFVFGMDASPTLRQRAEALESTRRRRLHRPAPYQSTSGATRARRPNHKQRIVKERGYLNLELNFEDVAEFFYIPGKCSRAYRVVVVRKNISRSRGEDALFDEIAGSDRSALPGSLPVGFPDPPSEPAVHVTAQRALHVSCQTVSR